MLKYAADVIVRRVSLDMQLDNSAAEHDQEQRYTEKNSLIMTEMCVWSTLNVRVEYTECRKKVLLLLNESVQI
jgi:hypothetical protein